MCTANVMYLHVPSFKNILDYETLFYLLWPKNIYNKVHIINVDVMFFLFSPKSNLLVS